MARVLTQDPIGLSQRVDRPQRDVFQIADWRRRHIKAGFQRHLPYMTQLGPGLNAVTAQDAKAAQGQRWGGGLSWRGCCGRPRVTVGFSNMAAGARGRRIAKDRGA